MSTYMELTRQVQTLKAQIAKASAKGSTAILIGILAGVGALIFLLAAIVSRGGLGAWVLPILAGITAAAMLGLGTSTKRRQAQSVVPVLSQQLKAAEAERQAATQRREAMLARLQRGDLAVLTEFRDYLAEETEYVANPSSDALVFRPQKAETCYLQVTGVHLQRLKSRTVTRRTGGGYRVGSFYVPVSKERVQYSEMQDLDQGTLAITSKRVLYLGRERKLTVSFDKILELQAYTDALSITKEGSKSADFYGTLDGAFVAAALAAAQQPGDRLPPGT